MKTVSTLIVAAAALVPTAAFAHPGHAIVALAQSSAPATLMLAAFGAMMAGKATAAARRVFARH